MGYSRTTRPGRALMRTTRSARVMASVRSWVTYRMVQPVFSQRERISSCRRCRVKASKGAKGSSIMRMAGSTASTRAMAARFFMPPESSRG